MRHGFKIGETDYDIGLSRARNGYRLHIDEREIPINLTPGEQGHWQLRCDETITPAAIAVDGDDIYIHLDGRTHHLRYEHPLQRLAERHEAAGGDSVKATMPGSLVSLEVAEGERVTIGQTLLVIESMKMETTFAAPRDGIVQTVHVATGETFDKGAALVTLEPEE